MNSPFKFLDSYTKEDKDIFFGRDREIEELYQKVFESKILLLVGISGTGKSSLIDCGLGNKFEDSDWLPVAVRRGSHMIDSLVAQLSSFDVATEDEGESRKAKGESGVSGKDIVKKIKSVYLDHFKPIYLIFDQFEELFIFGSKEERQEFIAIVKEVIDSDVQCRFIFSIREEYVAGTMEFERKIYDFFRNKMRVEKMTWNNAKMAIEGPCKVHGIEVEEGFADAMLEKLGGGSSEVDLTYLQIFLDKLFQLAIKKNKDKPVFNRELIEKVGDVSDLLGSFLEEQITEMDDPDSALVVLKSFVSIKGTKRQITEDEVLEASRTLGKDIPSKDITEMIRAFVDLRILRDKDDNGRYELRHDSLASKIYEKITLVEKEMLEIRQFLETALNNHEKRGIYLSKEDLHYIAPYEDRLFMSKMTEKFIGDSKSHVAKARRRIRMLISAATIALVIVMGGFTFWALRERNTSKEKELRFKASYLNSLSKEIVKLDPTIALRIAEIGYDMNPTEIINQNIHKIYRENIFYKTICSFGSDPFLNVSYSEDRKLFLFQRKIDVGPHNFMNRNTHAQVWSIDGYQLLNFYDSEYSLIGSNDILNIRVNNLLSCSISPSGEYVLIQDEENIIVYNLEGTKEIIIPCNSSEGKSFKAKFSTCGNYIIRYRSNILSYWIYDFSGQEVISYENEKKESRDIFMSPNGQYVVTYGSSYGSNFEVRELNGKIILNHKNPTFITCNIAFSPDGNSFLIGNYDGSIYLWDVPGKSVSFFGSHFDEVSTLMYFKDGSCVISGSKDKTIKIWTKDGDQIHQLLGCTGKIIFAAETGSRDVISISEGKLMKWKLPNSHINSFEQNVNTRTSQGSLDGLKYSRDGSRIISYNSRGANLWDTLGYHIMKFSVPKNIEFIASSAINTSDEQIYFGYNTGVISVYDFYGLLVQQFVDHVQSVNDLAISKDGNKLLSGSSAGKVMLRDLTSDSVLFSLEDVGGISSVRFSEKDDRIILGTDEGMVKVYSLNGNQIDHIKLGDDTSPITDVSLNGNKVLAACDKNYVFNWGDFQIFGNDGDGNIWLYDIESGLIELINDSDFLSEYICFSDNGKYILSGYPDGRVILSSNNGIEFQEIICTDGVDKSALAPDGGNFITYNNKGKIQMWQRGFNLKEFQQKNFYDSLEISTMLSYGISEYYNLESIRDPDILFSLAKYFFNESKVGDNTTRQQMIQESIDVYKRLKTHVYNIRYSLWYFDFLCKQLISDPSFEYYEELESEIERLLNFGNAGDLTRSAYLFYDRAYGASDESIEHELLRYSERIFYQLYALHTNIEIPEIFYSCLNRIVLLELKNQNFEDAYIISKKGSDVSNDIRIHANLVLANIYRNDLDEAKRIIGIYQDSLVNEQLFKDYLIDRISEFESNDISHPSPEILSLLNREITEPAETE